VPNGRNRLVNLGGLHLFGVKVNGKHFAVYIPVGKTYAFNFGSLLYAFFTHAAIAVHLEFGCHLSTRWLLGLGEIEAENEYAEKKYLFHDEKIEM
jgi:hypothetical protein